jgi:type I restriction enzyme M protein
MAHLLSLPWLENLLEKPCESLRGNMDALDFKEYVIVILFLKRVNDGILKERDAASVELAGYLKELGYE